MKRLLALLLALAMALSLVACGNTADDDVEDDNNPSNVADDNAPEGTPDVDIEDDESINVTDPQPPASEGDRLIATNILEDIWNNYPEEFVFMSFGGDYENNVENAPYDHTIADGGEELDSSIGYPAEMIDKISEAAAMRHMLNVNNFTCGAYYVNDPADIQAISDGIVDNLMNRSYLCGAPQWLIVMKVYDYYVVNVFGAEDLVNAFKDAAIATYGDEVTILHDDSMEGAHGDNGIDMGGLGLDGIGF